MRFWFPPPPPPRDDDSPLPMAACLLALVGGLAGYVGWLLVEVL